MIRATRLFELRHPYLSVLVLLSNVVIVGVLLWGWTVLRFSPLQRHYLPPYFASSSGAQFDRTVKHVEWVDKTAPGKKPETALLDDVVSAPADAPGGVAFQLSRAARAEGWTGVAEDPAGGYPSGELRDFLEDRFFGGRSFLILFLQPFEIVLIGYLVKKAFDNWRRDLAIERGALWDPSYRPTSWDEDLLLLIRITSQGAKASAVQGWQWVKVRRRNAGEPVKATALSVVVSSSRPVGPAASKRIVPESKTPAPVAATVVEIVAARKAEPSISETRSQPVKAAVDAKPVPAVPKSPFGKPSTEGEPERKWDLSQWID